MAKMSKEQRKKCVKMAWAFMNIMNVVHHNGILHDDLLKDNIMLHFLFSNPYVLYIGVCNWGEIRRLQEVIPFLYGFSK
jgi:tRNA A-37 threonylcarbamoyl transferase component Bud32